MRKNRAEGKNTKVDILQFINYCVVHRDGPPTADEIAEKLGANRQWMAVTLSRYVRHGVLVAVKKPGQPTRYGVGDNAFGEIPGKEWARKQERKRSASKGLRRKLGIG